MHDGVYRPAARRGGVLVEALDEDLLVFDAERQVAHSLNASAARVWEACDGSRSVSELAEECQEDEATVLLALARLREVHLLEQNEFQPPHQALEPEGVSRRLMLRKSVVAGAGVGLAIPVIRSITAPSIAMATSGRNPNPRNRQPCGVGSPCSPGSTCKASVGVCLRRGGQACSPMSLCSTAGGPISCQHGTCP